MILDGEALIQKQLKITSPAIVSDGEGRETELMPVRQVPRLNDESMHLSLDGEWKVKRWPFPTPEATLTEKSVKDTQWEKVVQPGKVFYADPEAEAFGKQSKDWNRVSQTHIDEKDGAVMRHVVRIPIDWTGKRVILRFDSY